MRKRPPKGIEAATQGAEPEPEVPATEESVLLPRGTDDPQDLQDRKGPPSAPPGETPSYAGAAPEALVVASAPPKTPPTSPAPPEPAELPDPWSDEIDKKQVLLRKRSLPRKTKVVLVAVALSFAGAVIVSRRAASVPEAAPTLKLQDDMIIPDEDLKRRREVTAHDFAPKRPFLHTAPAAPRQSPSAESETVPIDVERRRAERAADPEDVATLPDRHRGASPARVAARPRRAARALFLEDTPSPPARELADDVESFPLPPVSGRARRHGRPLVPAGATLAATLLTPIQLPHGNPTVVATTTEGGILPAGTRLLGIASLSDTRVDITFRRLVLPGGEELSMSGQAQDRDGAFGLAVALTSSGEDNDEEPSLARDVAVDATSELAQGLLGGGILGRAGSSYIRGKNQRSYPRRGEGPTATLPAGTDLVVFFEESLAR
jgi:hypothetical protein